MDDLALERGLLALRAAECRLGLTPLLGRVGLVVIVVASALARDRVLELAHPTPELASQSRKALGPEHEKEDHQHDEELW
jgi:hypothetical protein